MRESREEVTRGLGWREKEVTNERDAEGNTVIELSIESNPDTCQRCRHRGEQVEARAASAGPTKQRGTRPAPPKRPVTVGVPPVNARGRRILSPNKIDRSVSTSVRGRCPP
ncbi:hypothetical protein GCM10020219_060180 [Nonomuraea dietziae]